MDEELMSVLEERYVVSPSPLLDELGNESSAIRAWMLLAQADICALLLDHEGLGAQFAVARTLLKAAEALDDSDVQSFLFAYVEDHPDKGAEVNDVLATIDQIGDIVDSIING
jgi:hypothetical protein